MLIEARDKKRFLLKMQWVRIVLVVLIKKIKPNLKRKDKEIDIEGKTKNPNREKATR